ncbi:MAG: glycoside hydrolase [Fuerstiella sp.]|nr:glycoside hydrolase [Fuerstiella sp.]
MVMKSGAFPAVCEGRADGGGLTGNVDLVCKRSVDYGLTGSQRGMIADLDRNTVGNQSVLVDGQTGVVWIAHSVSPGEELEEAITRGKTKDSTCVFVTHSKDEGPTRSMRATFFTAMKRTGCTWNAGTLLLRRGDSQYSSLALLANGQVAHITTAGRKQTTNCTSLRSALTRLGNSITRTIDLVLSLSVCSGRATVRGSYYRS